MINQQVVWLNNQICQIVPAAAEIEYDNLQLIKLSLIIHQYYIVFGCFIKQMASYELRAFLLLHADFKLLN